MRKLNKKQSRLAYIRVTSNRKSSNDGVKGAYGMTENHVSQRYNNKIKAV